MLACTWMLVHASASINIHVDANRTDRTERSGAEKNGTDQIINDQNKNEHIKKELIPTDVGFWQKMQSSPIFGGWELKN